MLEVFGYVALLLALAAIVVLGVASRKPDDFVISRTASIAAPPERIFPLIDSPRAFNTWNPFLKLDPDTKVSYRGPERGPGAGNDWSGNRNVGSGSFEVLEAQAPRKVVMRLDMKTPMEAHNRVEFVLVPNGAATDVSWTMSGPSPLLAKVMSTFCSMDKMCGTAFEQGLADLKALAEK